MSYYRVRLAGWNTRDPQVGSVEVVVRVEGWSPDNAISRIRRIAVSADLSQVNLTGGLGPGTMGFWEWSVIGRPRVVDGPRDGYVVDYVKPARTIAQSWS